MKPSGFAKKSLATSIAIGLAVPVIASVGQEFQMRVALKANLSTWGRNFRCYR